MEIPSRASAEKGFAKRMSRLTTKHRKRLRGLLGNPPDVRNVPESFWDEVSRETEETTLLMVYLVFLASANYHAFGDEAGTDDPLADTLDDQAHAYSQRKSIEIALSYVKTSRKLVQQLGREIDELKNVVDVDPETGARTITRDEDAVPTAQDLEDGLARAFGPSRAAAVSVTQTTDAQSVGGDAGIAATVGLSDGDIWITETDERVCVICEPLHLMARRVWRAQYPTGPPAHVNCRCIVGYENGSRSELGADVA